MMRRWDGENVGEKAFPSLLKSSKRGVNRGEKGEHGDPSVRKGGMSDIVIPAVPGKTASYPQFLSSPVLTVSSILFDKPSRHGTGDL